VYTDKQLQRLDLSLFCATCSSLRDRRNHHSPAAPLSSLPASYTPFLMSVIAASSAALLVTRDWTKYQYYQVETRACRCSCSGQVSAKLGKQLAAPLSVSFCLLEFASISSSSSNFQRERIGKSRQQVAVIWRETHPVACYHIPLD